MIERILGRPSFPAVLFVIVIRTLFAGFLGDDGPNLRWRGTVPHATVVTDPNRRYGEHRWTGPIRATHDTDLSATTSRRRGGRSEILHRRYPLANSAMVVARTCVAAAQSSQSVHSFGWCETPFSDGANSNTASVTADTFAVS